MTDQHEHAMRNYARLAAVSWQRRQLPGRDRLLVLCGAAACRAGYLQVARRCRELVLTQNPRHLLHRYESFPDALRDDDFAPFLRQLERQCSPEQAEFLVNRVDPSANDAGQEVSAPFDNAEFDNAESEDSPDGDAVEPVPVEPVSSEEVILSWLAGPVDEA